MTSKTEKRLEGETVPSLSNRATRIAKLANEITDASVQYEIHNTVAKKYRTQIAKLKAELEEELEKVR